MSSRIKVDVWQIHNGIISEPVNAIPLEKTIKRMDEIITVGRGEGNDIRMWHSFISTNHGRIFAEKGVFTTHLDYEDFSRYGTTVLHWRRGLKGETVFVHTSKVKITPGDWILITEQGVYGVLLIPRVL